MPRTAAGKILSWPPRRRRIAGRRVAAGVGRGRTGVPGGARVCIEGPAEFAPRSGGRVELNCGRLVAYVPAQARGFTVNTPTAEVIDLGTEFGVEVNRQGRTDLVVIKGQVEVKPVAKDAAPARRGQRVVAGQAVRVAADDRTPTPVEFNPAKFAAVRETIAATSVAKETNESFGQGAPIWLGNLFDDRVDAQLADAVRTDPFKSVPKAHMSLGVERVYHAGQFFGSDNGAANWDGAGKLQVTPTLVLDLTNLGWKGMQSGAISNDVYTRYGDLPDGTERNTGPISTRGTLPFAHDRPSWKKASACRPTPCSLSTSTRFAPPATWPAASLVFWSERAGINDGSPAPRTGVGVHAGGRLRSPRRRRRCPAQWPGDPHGPRRRRLVGGVGPGQTAGRAGRTGIVSCADSGRRQVPELDHDRRWRHQHNGSRRLERRVPEGGSLRLLTVTDYSNGGLPIAFFRSQVVTSAACCWCGTQAFWSEVRTSR